LNKSLDLCNLNAKKLNKMKNIFALLLVASMFVFASCDNAATTTEDTITTEVHEHEAGHDHDAIVVEDDTTAVAADTAAVY
jgi:hypothetical protein